MHLEKVLYTAHATVVGGRNGTATTTDGRLHLKLSRPPELGGAVGSEGTNPEQLFAVGYAACFIGAMGVAAGQHKLALPQDTRITADVGIGPLSQGFGIQVALNVHVPGWDHEQTEKLVHAAHKVCPYSNATRGNVEVTLKAV